MLELELLGLDSEGNHIVLTDIDGARYQLRINDTLRALVRRDRPNMEAISPDDSQLIAPREIQALIRAGAQVEEVVAKSGLDRDHVMAFATPIMAERSWVATQAQQAAISHQPGSPVLGELVVDRLAARGVEPFSLQWDSLRRPGGSWEVKVSFVEAATEKTARWNYDLPTGSVKALDEEARFLTETKTDSGSNLHAADFSQGADGTDVTEAADELTHRLLAELNAGRGQRPAVVMDFGDDFDELGDQIGMPGGGITTANEDGGLAGEIVGEQISLASDTEPPTAPVVSLAERQTRVPVDSVGSPAEVLNTPAPTGVEDSAAVSPVETATPPLPDPADSGIADTLEPATLLELTEPATTTDEIVARVRKGKRRSVPSWDEIVFGTKPE